VIIHEIPARLELIVFDIDNTLYRHDEYQRIQVELLIDRYAAHRSITREEALTHIEVSRKTEAERTGHATTSMGNAMRALGIELEENAKWRSELYHPEKYLKPDIALQDSIRRLSSRFKLFTVTNNSREIGDRTLATLGIRAYVVETIGLETVGESKPSNALFQWALDRSGCDAENSLSVGDRYEVDIVPALSIGMGGIFVESMEDVYNLPDTLDHALKS
jgi:FMN phosphatase YigB (HAD superfamily)